MVEEVVEFYKFNFREVFRVGIPGLWFLVCAHFLSSPIWKTLSYLEIIKVTNGLNFLNTFELIILALGFGLLWFSLQIPRKLPKYKKAVSHLKDYMLQLVDKKEPLIDKPAYDYLMENYLPSGAKWRIHYFASMYYMFMDITIISIIWFFVNFFFFIYNLSWSPILFFDIFPLIILGTAIIFEISSSDKFLIDVELFSLYCLMVNKIKLTELIKIAQESDVLNNMEATLKSKNTEKKIFFKKNVKNVVEFFRRL